MTKTDRNSYYKVKNSEDIQSILVCGFMKSGTVYFTNIISDYLGFPKVFPGLTEESLRYCVMQGHWTYDDPFIQEYSQISSSFYIVRDFRDILVSAYHYCCSNRFEFKEKFTTIEHFFFQSCCKGEVLACDQKAWVDHVHGWLLSGVSLVRYEDLIESPFNEMKRLFLDAGWHVDEDKLRLAIENNSFSKLQASGSSSLRSPIHTYHFRKGQSGQWRKELSEKIIDHLYSVNYTLERLGYLEICNTKRGKFRHLLKKYPIWHNSYYSTDGRILGDPKYSKLAEDRFRMVSPLVESILFNDIQRSSVIVMDAGQGYYIVQLARMGFRRVVGVERNKQKLSMAVSLLKTLKLTNAEFLSEEQFKLSNREEFDMCLMLDGLGVYKNQGLLLEQLYIQTKKCLYVNCDDNGGNGVKIVTKKAGVPNGVPDLFFEPSKRALVKMLRDTGFGQVTQVLPYRESHPDLVNFREVILCAFKSPYTQASNGFEN